MSSSASRGDDRGIRQDYVTRVRYSNVLPPPPNPPKLLDIPNTGLASGQYTNPGFASRLAREQPLNIEADAELGMPIDLVGMPGIFDGDESSIQAPMHPPVPHPHDRQLLRPLASLGKPKTSESGVSFLRRTEYISSGSGKSRFDASNPKPLNPVNTNRVKKLPRDLDKEDPQYIKAKVEQSFQIAQARLANSNSIRHPTKRNVRLVSTQPLLPDLSAFSDFGGYVTMKFATNPVLPSSKYDRRLEAALFRAIEPTEDAIKARELAEQLHAQDPSRYTAPPPEQNYEFFLLEGADDAAQYKRKLDELDPDKDSDELYTYTNNADARVFRFSRIREYETAATVDQMETKYDDELVLASHDGRDPKRQKAMYYYPVIQRQTIRPQRKKNMDQRRYGYQEEETANYLDNIDITVRPPHDDEIKLRSAWADNPLKDPMEDEGGADLDGDVDADGEAEELINGRIPENGASNGQNGVHDGDHDASGSDD